MIDKAAEWLSRRGTAQGIRSRHFWIIAALMAVFAVIYYVDQTPFVNTPPFNNSFFTTIHDLHRTLFFIPIIYAALVFRVKGSLLTSGVFLIIILPRALLYSPNPDPLVRPLLFVIFAALISTLLAFELNLVDRERKARAELSAVQTDRLTSLGHLAASVAHEVNNPLAGVLLYTQLLAKKVSAGNISRELTLDYLQKMEAELVRSTRLIRNLLEFARQSPPALREVDVNEVINATGIPLKSKPEKAELNDAAGDSGGEAFDLGYSAKLQHIEVVTELDPDLPRLMADFDQLQQVFTNLILNAIQAMPRGGRLTIRTARNGGWVRIEVKDTGSGISRENMPRLFTPFFTTRPEVKGVGLGLAVAYGIIQRHQGRIEVQSEAGKGSTFSVYLPLDNLSTNKRQTLPNPE